MGLGGEIGGSISFIAINWINVIWPSGFVAKSSKDCDEMWVNI